MSYENLKLVKDAIKNWSDTFCTSIVCTKQTKIALFPLLYTKVLRNFEVHGSIALKSSDKFISSDVLLIKHTLRLFQLLLCFY